MIFCTFKKEKKNNIDASLAQGDNIKVKKNNWSEQA